jgi:hypothetical protein
MNFGDSTVNRRWVSACNRWLDSWRGRLLLASAVMAAYLYAYWTHPARPEVEPAFPLGWWGWWDQSQYIKCAASLAHGSLTRDTYWYPLGYPALGAVFYRAFPLHAFLIPNLLFVIAAVLAYYYIARKFVTALEAWVLLVAFSICYRGTIALSLVEPWNTIPTLFLSYALIAYVGLSNPTRTTILWGGVGLGLMYLCRPPDAACLGLILVVAILRVRPWSEMLKAGLAATAIMSFFVVPVLLLNRSVFGSWQSEYEKAGSAVGFGAFPFAPKAFALLIDAKPFFHLKDTALLSHFPWLVLLLPGALFFVRKYKWNAVGVLLSIAATYLLYLSFNDFWPGNIFRYHLIHYLFWTFPILALLAYLSVREGWKDRVGRIGYVLILPILIPACFLSMKENLLGQVTLPATANLSLPPAGLSKIDWILLNGATSDAGPFTSQFGLTPFRDFIRIGREDERVMLLGSRARKGPITIAPDGAQGATSIAYGSIDWSLRWPPRPFRERFRSAGCDVIVRRAADGVDVAGPNGGPDGVADAMIELECPEADLRQVTAWDLETNDHAAHWVSTPNPHGWWIIKTVSSLTNAPSGRAGIRLCFPDFGQLEAAPAATLRGTDVTGHPVVQIEIESGRSKTR